MIKTEFQICFERGLKEGTLLSMEKYRVKPCKFLAMFGLIVRLEERLSKFQDGIFTISKCRNNVGN